MSARAVAARALSALGATGFIFTIFFAIAYSIERHINSKAVMALGALGILGVLLNLFLIVSYSTEAYIIIPRKLRVLDPSDAEERKEIERVTKAKEVIKKSELIGKRVQSSVMMALVAVMAIWILKK